MKGHIRQRGKKSWAIKVDIGRDVTGRRRTKWISVKGTKRTAERELTRVLHELNTGAFVAPANMTVGDYLEKWLVDHARHKVSAKTFERYAEIVRKHLMPALGAHQLARLAPLHVQNYLGEALASGRRPRPKKIRKPGDAPDNSTVQKAKAWKADTAKKPQPGLSPLTVKHHYRVLSQALRQAVKLQLVARNVCDAVDPPRAARKEMNIIDQKQAAELLQAAEGLSIYAPVLLAITTGMRRGEILGLRWRDIDLDAGMLSVVQALEQTSKGLAFKAPKTARSRRTISLPALTVEGLRWHKAKQNEERMALGKAWQANDLVCPRSGGAPMSPRELTKAFGRLARKRKLGVRFHDLRHSHISHLLAAGVHPKITSERAGHASVSITLDVYSHLMPGMQEDAARKIDAALRTALEQ